jgi:competence protein ComEA
MNGQTLAIRGIAVVAAAVIAFSALRPGAHEAAPNIVISDDASNQQIAVEIYGAVAKPGLYWLTGDVRLQTVIDAAGGARSDADLSGVNLARRVEDEEQIEIPFLPDPNATVSAAPAAGSAVAPASGKININLATAAELDALPGIGPALAGRIVAYREQHGPFASLEELSNVSGISVRMVDELRDLISLGS